MCNDTRKKASIVMALKSARTAIVIGAGVLLTATIGAAVYNRFLQTWEYSSPAQDLTSQFQVYAWQAMFPTDYSQQDLERIPPQVKIVPTVFPSRLPDYRGLDGKYIGIVQSMDSLVAFALHTSECRVIFESKLKLEERYDFIANLPGNDRDNREALRQEIEKQFSLTVEKEKRMTDVLLLTVKNRDPARFAGRKINVNSYRGKPGTSAGATCPFSDFPARLENWLDVPVVDRTGLAGRHYFIQDFWIAGGSKKCGNPDGLKKALWDELGMTLVPGREMVEMFVVKEKKQ
jgi:uncharacterized protein (TIGR03435 family)